MKFEIICVVLVALTALGLASTTCEYNTEPWLGSDIALNCHTDVISSRCYAYINETTSGTAIEIVPSTAFSAYDEAIHPLPGGSFAVGWNLNAQRYTEGNNYTFTTYCENTSSSESIGGTFLVQGFAQPAWAASYLKWGMDNAAYLVGGLLVIGGIATLVVFTKRSYGFR